MGDRRDVAVSSVYFGRRGSFIILPTEKKTKKTLRTKEIKKIFYEISRGLNSKNPSSPPK